MPTYTYRCDRCGREFDRTQRITDEALRVCDLEVAVDDAVGGMTGTVVCGGLLTKLVVGGGGFVLKGGGWGKDGY